MIIAIDGPAGAGKSTVAKKLAQKLEYIYVDTGAMYRALTLKLLRGKIDFADVKLIEKIAQDSRIELMRSGQGMLRVLLDGEDVSDEIRSLKVTNSVFHAAGMPEIRRIMVSWQRKFGNSENIVMEGRDIGTVVFPGADIKFYLDASVDVRAQRRFKELAEKNVPVDMKELISDIEARDQRDKTRECGPLKIASDAVYIDTTPLNIEEVVEKMLEYVKKK